MIHIRNVIAGISGSSMLETDARTSGNGLSSSSSPKVSKSNPILHVKVSQHQWGRRRKGFRAGQDGAESDGILTVKTYLMDSVRLSESITLGELSSTEIECDLPLEVP
jgi:hypothetical protein